LSGSTIVGLALGLILAPVLSRRFKGMSPGEVVATVLEMVAHAVGYVVDLLSRLIKTFTGKKSIALPDK